MATKVFDMSTTKAIEYYDQQVERAAYAYFQMLAYDWPEHQVRIVQDELQERITMAERVRRIYQKLNRGHKKHS